ncbi:FtsX-like permease family protein [Sneathiella sp. CAU 1612]|uniref:FtsX-like permease family protein n=1 Tax=Sneathiella sedimenti TaxID=2816034 RepID=A0ABS3F0N5_9PROT|nr:FtsX-like permease family protein [Sneathiella sedimenti]MBO0332073.1 FtsX-like permease family protein [Sneathiella sedimenti]
MTLALRFARRDLRGNLKGFRIFLACLILGVAAIAGVGTLSSSITAGLRANGQVILGGDIDIRLTHRGAVEDERRWVEEQGRVSEIQTLRAMVRDLSSDRRTLSELKAIDNAYPLFGMLTLASETGTENPDALLQQKNGLYGVLIEKSLSDRLELPINGQVRIGELNFEVRGIILSEPDKASQGMALGPRTIISSAALNETGLVQPGSLIRYHYRIALAPGKTVAGFYEDAKAAFPDTGWRIRDASNGAPGIKRFVDRVALFLTLVGLTALVVGGVGVGNAVRAYLEGKITTIATLKCLGASSSFIFRVHYLQVLILAVAGSLIGLLLGVGGSVVAAQFLASTLPVPPEITIKAGPLLLATAYGLLTATLFTIWPLARARETPAAALFRDVVSSHRRPRSKYLVTLAACFATLVALAILTSQETWFAAVFTISIIGIFSVLILVGYGVQFIARRLPRSRIPSLRLAIANLYRPGAATNSIILSMGLGLTLFVTVALIEGNLTRQVQEQLPEKAPAFFFIDIQSNQLNDFVSTAESVIDVSEINHVPNMRGRITKVAGVPADQVTVAPEARWALRGDRGITYAATPPEGAVVVAGSWWPEDYAGPPLVSMDREIALGMGLEIGDSLTVNVMGREIEAKIANLREIDWTTMAINFVLVFDSHSLQGAPHSHLATARADGDAENKLFSAITNKFANVSVIRMKEALQTVSRILEQLSSAVSAISSITLVTGVLVLAGAFAAGHRKRVYDAVILKVLGATRKDIFATFLLEYALLGLVTSVIAAATGWFAAYMVITDILEAKWISLPFTIVATILISVLVTLLFGLLGSWRALGTKVAPALRSD